MGIEGEPEAQADAGRGGDGGIEHMVRPGVEVGLDFGDRPVDDWDQVGAVEGAAGGGVAEQDQAEQRQGLVERLE